MTGFDAVLVVDWSAGKAAPKRPSKDAIWMALARGSNVEAPIYCRTRQEAEARICEIMAGEVAAGRRLLACFDFPFGYPHGFARHVTGSDDPLAFWDHLAARIEDATDGSNNRFDVASEINRLFAGPGPFWGKPRRDAWPDVPYTKAEIPFHPVPEKRQCDGVSGASSSCFQLFYNPTVGSQALMGLPVLARLRRAYGCAVWPFEDGRAASVVLAEIWPGLIEPAVKAVLAREDGIRDAVQVRLLARALGALSPQALTAMLDAPPPVARKEGWILGAGEAATLTALAEEGAPLVPPLLRNDCFALPPGVHWTPVATALEALRANITPVASMSEVGLEAAVGRVLARDVQAARSNPPLPNSAVDGYGFAGGLEAGAHEIPLAAGRAAAGDAPGALPTGHALRVLTGAALPDGVETVVLQEDVTVGAGRIALNGPVKLGANTRRAGEDVAAGDTVLSKGTRVGPAEAALLAATGVYRLWVHAPLRVGVISTGSELVDAGETARAGQIFDANRPMLLEMIRQFGHTPVDLGRVPDDRSALKDRLDRAATQTDAVLTSGGASAGDEDHVSALLSEAGAMTLWRIAVKPGRPLALGLWQGTPVFGLPGNPVAAMVCTLIFARPALMRLAGAQWPEPQGFDVPAAFSKRKKPGRAEYLRARIRAGRAEIFASEGSGRVSGLAWADGLVALPEDAAEITPGTPVRYLPFSSFGLAP